jgi:hypothetical protein
VGLRHVPASQRGGVGVACARAPVRGHAPPPPPPRLACSSPLFFYECVFECVFGLAPCLFGFFCTFGTCTLSKNATSGAPPLVRYQFHHEWQLFISIYNVVLQPARILLFLNCGKKAIPTHAEAAAIMLHRPRVRVGVGLLDPSLRRCRQQYWEVPLQQSGTHVNFPFAYRYSPFGPFVAVPPSSDPGFRNQFRFLRSTSERFTFACECGTMLRYAWSNYPECVLFDQHMLPVGPFSLAFKAN